VNKDDANIAIVTVEDLRRIREETEKSLPALLTSLKTLTRTHEGFNQISEQKR
jgi:molybdopterin biosynthesis enzyme MoaB